MDAAERRQFEELMRRGRDAAQGGQSLKQIFQVVTDYVTQGALRQARAYLVGVRNTRVFSAGPRSEIEDMLRQIEEAEAAEAQRREEQRRRQEQSVAELYYRSVRLYRTGQRDEARSGFIEVWRSGLAPPPIKAAVENYLADLDAAPNRR